MKIGKYITSILMTSALALTVGCSNDNIEDKSEEVKPDKEIVVATSVAVTEILDELGVKVSGVPTSSYELPKNTENAVKVGNPMNPDLEIIKSLKPTIVVSVDTLGEDFKKMFIQNNIPSEFVNLSTLDGLKETIKILGEKFDKIENANKILNELENKQAELESKEKSNEKVMIVFGAPGSIMIGTNNSYIGNLVEVSGGNNIFKEGNAPYIPVNMEEIIKSNPDKILVMTHAMPEESQKMIAEEFAKASWQNINAIKNNKIHYLQNGYFGMSANLKAADALDILGDILYE